MQVSARRTQSWIMLVAVWLAGALALQAAPAYGQDDDSKKKRTPYPDCGGLWLGKASARARVDVKTGLFPRLDATVRWDIPADAVAADRGLPQIVVLECFPGGETAGDPKLAPVSAIVSRGTSGAVQVVWNLTGSTPALTQRRFHVYMAPAGAEALPNRAREGTAVALPGENLLPNPSFEAPDPQDPSKPLGWTVSGTESLPQGTVRGVRDAARAADGQWSAWLATEAQATDGKTPTGSVELAEPLVVRPGVRYFLDADVRVEAATGVGATVSAVFVDARGRELPGGARIATAPGAVDQRWEHLRSWAYAPDEARAVKVVIAADNSRGSAFIDNVTLYADPVGLTPAPRVIPLPIERKADYRRSLQLSRGADAWLFDFGPEGSAVAGGFRPAGAHTPFDSVRGYGFCGGGEVVGNGGERPEALGQDFVDLGGKPFCAAIPDGPVLVWALMGDYRAPDWSRWEPPPFYDRDVTLTIGGRNLRVQKRALDFSSLHASGEDDAVQVLRAGAFAIWDRYVSPRFTHVLFDAEAKDGVLEIKCGPAGACPVAAIGIFKGATMADVKDALDYHGAIRRWSFTVGWAQATQAETHTAPYEVTPDDESRGYVPFAVDTATEVYPHTTPTVEQVEALNRGLSLRAARGETTALSLGIYPISFRRVLEITVQPPYTELGEPIDPATIDLDVVRYRALRLDSTTADPRFALRPRELAPPTSLSVRPGLTRQFWATVRVPPDANPGSYSGLIEIRVGRDELFEIPYTIEIVDIELGPIELHQGIVGGELPHGGDLAAMYRDYTDHGMNILTLPVPPQATGTGASVRADFARWDTIVAASRAGGMEAIGHLTQFAGEPAFALTGEPTTDSGFAPNPMVRQKRQFSSEFDATFTELIAQATRHAARQDWPPVVHLITSSQGVVPEPSATYQRHLLDRCAVAGDGTLCAAVLGGPGALESLDQLDAALPHPALGADAALYEQLRTKRDKSQRALWLYNAGGGRYGRGLYPWTVGANAVVHEGYTQLLGAGDPFDDWDSDNRVPVYVLPAQGLPIRTLRWERARLGVNDVRWLDHVRRLQLGAERRGKKAAKAVRTARAFLDQLRDRVEERMAPHRSAWDGTLIPPTFPAGDEFDRIREALITLALDLK